MLKVENLCVNFGDFKALRNVSLEIPDGEFLRCSDRPAAEKPLRYAQLPGS